MSSLVWNLSVGDFNPSFLKSSIIVVNTSAGMSGSGIVSRSLPWRIYMIRFALL